jgi:hypothetical protein
MKNNFLGLIRDRLPQILVDLAQERALRGVYYAMARTGLVFLTGNLIWAWNRYV